MLKINDQELLDIEIWAEQMKVNHCDFSSTIFSFYEYHVVGYPRCYLIVDVNQLEDQDNPDNAYIFNAKGFFTDMTEPTTEELKYVEVLYGESSVKAYLQCLKATTHYNETGEVIYE